MKDNTKKTLKYYLRASAKYKVSGIIILVSCIGASVFDALSPIYFKNFFNILVDSNSQNQAKTVQMLLVTLAIIAAISMARWVCWRTISFLANFFQGRILADLANKCFAYLHRHSFTYFNNSFVGTLVKRVNWFTRAFEGVTDQILYNIIPLIVSLIMIFAILSSVNIWLGLAMIIWAGVFLTISWIFTKYKLKYDIQRNAAESSSTGLLADTITNNSNVKLFNGYFRELESFKQSTQALFKIRKFTWDLGSAFEALQSFLSVALEIGIFYVAIRLWQAGRITIGDFVLIQAYIFNIMDKVWSFNRVLRVIYENLSDAEEMTIIFNTPHEIQDVPSAPDLRVATGAIEFKNVTFNYYETRAVLKKFNLRIEPHQRLAIIGPSGAGKTTIIKLLFRMHDLTGGKILIDGQDIARVTQESLWHNVSLVPQDPILFHRTLKENIRYGRPEATDEEIIAAAKAAHCHEFIKGFEFGYETYVGERGVKLSGGERQRVAIARAILKNAPILVLDEATSSLDSESEGLIQDALNKLMKGKTVIVIAHRLSTIRKMDRIVVVDEGGIEEEGSHDELAKKKDGIYKKLWQLQAGGFIQ